MRKSGFCITSFTSSSSVLITLQRPQFPQLFSRSLREKRNKFWEAYAAQRWLLNWNWKMSSVLLCKEGDEKIENPPLPSREFLFAKHRHSQDNPLHNLWIIYIFQWRCINISVQCLAVKEWTKTFLDSYHITVLSLRLCDGGRIHGEKRTLSAISVDILITTQGPMDLSCQWPSWLSLTYWLFNSFCQGSQCWCWD